MERDAMTRNLEAEIDALRTELERIKSLLRGKTPPKALEIVSPPVPDPSIRVYKCRIPTDPRVQVVLDEMADRCNEENNLGRVMHFGVFASGGRQST